MNLRRLFAGTLLLSVLPLAACGPTNDTPSGSGGSSPAAAGGGSGGGTAAGRDACLRGTWSVDLQDLATQTAAKMPSGGGTGSGSGTIKVTFGDTMTLAYDAKLTVTSNSSSGMAIGVQDTFAGAASSTDYQAKDGKLTGTMDTDTVSMQVAVIVGTQTQPASAGPLSGTLDLEQGAATYTCDPSSLAITTFGTTWHLTKA